MIEPTHEGEEARIAHHEEMASATLVPKTNSWYMGSNVDGKPRRSSPTSAVAAGLAQGRDDGVALDLVDRAQ